LGMCSGVAMGMCRAVAMGMCSVVAMGTCSSTSCPAEVLLDPGRTWCPAPSCQAVCRLQGAESAAPQAVGCPGCGLEFCSACRAQRHPGRTCPDPSGTVGRFLPGEHR
jgi:hypothetical protein